MKNVSLRKDLIELLEGGSAHVSARKALQGLASKNRAVRPRGSTFSVWDLVEHMRIAQEDILRYTLDPQWHSPAWPDGYWPRRTARVTDAKWNAAVKRFFADLHEVVRWVEKSKIDLMSKIAHGEGHTYLREMLLIADHNAYHLGQIVDVRKALGDWKG
jgi:hypothetical protein